MLSKITMAYQLQNEHYTFVHNLFSQPADNKTKEVLDLPFVHPNAAQLSGIFPPKFTDTKLVYKLVGTQLSLLATFRVLFFQFVFLLPARYVRMRNFTGKSKQMEAVYS